MTIPSRSWTGGQQLRVVLAVHGRSETVLGPLLRREGLRAARLEEWRAAAGTAVEPPDRRGAGAGQQRCGARFASSRARTGVPTANAQASPSRRHVYEIARATHSARWRGVTRDRTPVTMVRLNPSTGDTLAQAHTAG